MWKPLISIPVVGLLVLAAAGPVLAQDKPLPEAAAAPPQEQKQAVPLFIPEQGRDQVLARSLIGAQVLDISGDEVGSVQDLILDSQGNAVGVVVRRGGLFGIGGTDIAVSFGPAEIENDEERETTIVRVNVTRDALEAGPEFMDAEDRQTEAARANRSAETPRPENGR